MNALARPRVLAPLVLAAALAAWLVTVERMRGMDGGPGTDEVDGGTGTDWCYNAETLISCET